MWILQEICLKESEVVLCGGSESMSQAPYAVRNIRFGTRFGFDLKVLLSGTHIYTHAQAHTHKHTHTRVHSSPTVQKGVVICPLICMTKTFLLLSFSSFSLFSCWVSLT